MVPSPRDTTHIKDTETKNGDPVEKNFTRVLLINGRSSRRLYSRSNLESWDFVPGKVFSEVEVFLDGKYTEYLYQIDEVREERLETG